LSHSGIDPRYRHASERYDRATREAPRSQELDKDRQPVLKVRKRVAPNVAHIKEV